MSEKKLMSIHDFSKGINNKDAPNLIPLNALTDAQNAVIQKGAVTKRPGYERFVSAPIERAATWQDIGGQKWSEL
jgi:hypothetical protein